MLIRVKELIKKKEGIAKVARYAALPIFYFENVISDLNFFLRREGYSNRYSELRRFKNIHAGKRCFIVATGPSLKVSDLDMLKDELTLSMNSIFMAFKETDWRPTYYAIQDEYVYKVIRDKLEQAGLKNIFVGSPVAKNFQVPPGSLEYPLHFLNHKYPTDKFKFKFSPDLSVGIYDGFTIAYSLIQIAVYMGFKQIYLLGCDCNYNQSKTHFMDYGSTDKTLAVAGHKMIMAYPAALKYCKENGVEIYNATRGGMLEVFERVNFDSLFPSDAHVCR